MLNDLRQCRILISTEVGIMTPYKLVGGCQKFWKNVLLPLLLLLLLLFVVVVIVFCFFWHHLNNTAYTLYPVPTLERTKTISIVKTNLLIFFKWNFLFIVLAIGKTKTLCWKVKIFYRYSKRDILLLQNFKNLTEASFCVESKNVICVTYTSRSNTWFIMGLITCLISQSKVC